VIGCGLGLRGHTAWVGPFCVGRPKRTLNSVRFQSVDFEDAASTFLLLNSHRKRFFDRGCSAHNALRSLTPLLSREIR